MPSCVMVAGQVYEIAGPIPDSSSGCSHVLLDYSQYKKVTELIASSSAGNGSPSGETISSLPINKDLYVTVNGWLLVSFITGHALGRVLKVMGKV